MSFEDIVKNEYNELTKSINDILKDHINYSVQIVSDPHTDNKILDVFVMLQNGINKKILSVKYEILGTYDTQTEIFCWGCDQLLVDKNLTNLSKSIKKYSEKIKKIIIKHQFKDSIFMERIYYYLTNNLFLVKPSNLQDILQIAIFVTHTKGILKSLTGTNNKIITFYLITDIISY